MDSNMVDIHVVEYKQWTSTDRSTMETIIQPVDEFLQSFMKALKTLKRHDLIAKQQSKFVTDALGPNEFLVRLLVVFVRMLPNPFIGISCRQPSILFLPIIMMNKEICNTSVIS